MNIQSALCLFASALLCCTPSHPPSLTTQSALCLLGAWLHARLAYFHVYKLYIKLQGENEIFIMIVRPNFFLTLQMMTKSNSISFLVIKCSCLYSTVFNTHVVKMSIIL